MGEIRIVIDSNIDHYTMAMREATWKFLEEAGLFLEGQCSEALEMDPRRVDTGTLQKSIKHKVKKEEFTCYVGTNIEYALYVHEGTKRMDPNRFLKNGFELNKGQVMSKYEAALKNA